MNNFKGYDINFSLAGKVAFITGGAADIGLAIANCLSRKVQKWH